MVSKMILEASPIMEMGEHRRIYSMLLLATFSAIVLTVLSASLLGWWFHLSDGNDY